MSVREELKRVRKDYNRISKLEQRLSELRTKRIKEVLSIIKEIVNYNDKYVNKIHENEYYIELGTDVLTEEKFFEFEYCINIKDDYMCIVSLDNTKYSDREGYHFNRKFSIQTPDDIIRNTIKNLVEKTEDCRIGTMNKFKNKNKEEE